MKTDDGVPKRDVA